MRNNKIKKAIGVLICVLFVQGCATTYKSIGRQGGYSEIQLDENIFKVSFSGNGHTSIERSEDFTLLRSAELTLNNGFKYFTIVESGNRVSNSTHQTPKTYNTTFSYGVAKTTQVGGYTYNVSKPSSTNTIVCYNKKPLNTVSYNATIVEREIKSKYKIKEN